MVQEVVQQIENTVNEMLTCGVHTALPATVTAVHDDTGLVDLQPVGSFYLDGQEIAYPLVPSVPLVISASTERGYACVCPVAAGDPVLMICTEQSLSMFLTGTESDQMDERFELQNAIAIPGLQRAAVEAQAEANADGAWILQYGSSKIKVTDGGIEITGTVTAGSLDISGSLTADSLTVSGSLHVGGNITCDGTYPGYSDSGED